jgi:NTP pyrophosphatase (non-canonical NTP hydrolase)
MLNDLDDVGFTIHSNAVAKGFYESLERMEEQDFILFKLKQLAMIHSEVTEVLEALRKNKGADVVADEMADIFIRLMDLYSFMRLNNDVDKSMAQAVREKMNLNSDRPKMHGVLA